MLAVIVVMLLLLAVRGRVVGRVGEYRAGAHQGGQGESDGKLHCMLLVYRD
ncbi:MAG: hypothetical protein Q8K35_00985 [Thiobacillus sp.]|nr:hypothetical protein [Thiobacillus sp.]